MRRMIKIAACAAWILMAACSKSSSPSGGVTNPPVITPITPLINLPQGWKYSTNYSTGLPTGMQVFAYDSIFAGKATKAFCLAYDSKPNRFEVKPVLSPTAKKPSEFFAQETGIVYGCINGGYFGGNQSFSLVKYNNVVSSPNIKQVNRTYNGSSTPYYPTRAAMGFSSTGVPSAAWVYSIGGGNDNIYSYPLPSPNAEGSAPQPVPTETFPAGGAAWTVSTAIGGSPMLLRNNNITISDVEELISINNTTSRPRSAIGYTANGIVLILAVEGDNAAAGYNGLNLQELATLLKNLGCTDAINLDGGGSTSMVIRNSPTVRLGMQVWKGL
jgi:Phosphodiester glycosidase